MQKLWKSNLYLYLISFIVNGSVITHQKISFISKNKHFLEVNWGDDYLYNSIQSPLKFKYPDINKLDIGCWW